ncbi:MAG: hypothetical protein HQM13_22280 [SAR324 cluster bacterium]|nr:hypothetical protein [SAR324 cluster bacterium]
MPHFSYSSIFTLGPAGTFSDEAAHRIDVSHSKIKYVKSFAEAALMLSTEADSAAVLPIENSVAGIVAPVQDLLITEGLVIVAEINLPVRYTLLVNDALEKVSTHFAHPQASEQTSKFTAKHLPESHVEFSNSNIDSGLRFIDASQQGKSAAAIVPASFAEKYPDSIHATDIQDYKSNTTRFIVVEKEKEGIRWDLTQQKTSLFIEFEDDRAGLLYNLLSIFNRYGINMCRLESRPSKDTPWFYVFYIDFSNNQNSQQCIEALGISPFRCKVLGSYSLIRS